MLSKLKSALALNVRNIPGWRTSRHIVVIESDDWGSIRMSSRENLERMVRAGMREDLDHYNTFDGLESNRDLEELYQVLTSFKDSTGRHPVMTGVNVVANPVFESIRENGFRSMYTNLIQKLVSAIPSTTGCTICGSRDSRTACSCLYSMVASTECTALVASLAEWK